MGAKNAIDLRRQLSEQQKLEASALQGVALVAGDAGSVAEQLLKALDKNFMRIIDLFREWDDDDSGTVSKVEFRRALPCLGLRVERADADALFDSFDVDKSGTIDYKELAQGDQARSRSRRARSNRRGGRAQGARHALVDRAADGQLEAGEAGGGGRSQEAAAAAKGARE